MQHSTGHSEVSLCDAPEEVLITSDQEKDFSDEFLMRLYVKLKKTIGGSGGTPLKRSASSDWESDSRELKRSSSYLGTVMNRLELFRSSSNESNESNSMSADEVRINDVPTKSEGFLGGKQVEHMECRSEECPICLEETPVTLLSITPCGHIFCVHCVKNYQGKSNTCIVCKHELKPDEVVSLHGLVGGRITTDTKESKSVVGWRRWGDRLHSKVKDIHERYKSKIKFIRLLLLRIA